MPQYCCVPGCKNKKGGHLFPTSPDLQLKWRVAIRRSNPRTGRLWSPNVDYDVVCHDHFLPGDYKQKYSRKVLKSDATPSVFFFREKDRTPSQVKRNQRAASKAAKEKVDVENVANEEIVVDDEEAADATLEEPKYRDASVQCFTKAAVAQGFSLQNFCDDAKAVRYFTGFDNYQHFLLLKEILGSGADQLNYCCSLLSTEDQLFLAIMKLRLGLDHQLLGYFFKISESTVSKIFSTWITFMYHQLKEIDIWPSKKVVQETMPMEFKQQYPTTRVIIDTTEIKIEKPSDVNNQRQTFSHYKNRNTIKLLVGMTPKGVVTYVIDCYGGAASDRQIIEESSLYQNAAIMFEPGDSIMADKGFLVQDLFAPFEVRINTPSVLKGATRLEEDYRLEDVTVSSKRVHVERIIGYAKTYKILQGVIPYHLLPLSNRMVFVCFMLINLRRSIISNNA